MAHADSTERVCRKSLVGCAVFYAVVNSAELLRSRNHSQALLQLIIPNILRVIASAPLDFLRSRYVLDGTYFPKLIR
jgi:hypothetical protein